MKLIEMTPENKEGSKVQESRGKKSRPAKLLKFLIGQEKEEKRKWEPWLGSFL